MGYYNEVLALVNQIRAEAGVGPLTLDTNLCRAASMRALEMDYANMIDAGYTKLGVGYSKTGIGSYGSYWVQLFSN